jgi:multiple sugar transport system substrate-binding protein
MRQNGLDRRDFLKLSAVAITGTVVAACAPAATPAPAVEQQPAAKVEEEPQAEKPAAPAEKIHLNYMDWGGETYPKAWEEVGTQFLEAHPDIDVEYMHQPDGANEKVITMYVAESDAAPDIFGHCCEHARRFFEAGQCLDLMPYWDTLPSEDVDDFDPNVIAFWTDQESGALFSVPKYEGNLVIFINLDMVKEAGITWPTSWDDPWTPDEYREALMKLNQGEVGQPGRVFGGAAWWGYEGRWDPFYHSNGGRAYNPEDNTECWLGTPEVQECLEFWRVLRWDDFSMPSPQDAGGERSPSRMFPPKITATSEDGSWFLRTAADQCTYPWDIIPLYTWPEGVKTLATTDGWLVWQKTKYPDAVWELLLFLMSPVYAKATAKHQFLQPSRLSLMGDYIQIIRENMPVLEDVNLELFKESREKLLGVPKDLCYDETKAREILYPVIEQVFLLGKAGVDAIATACDELTTELREMKAQAG